MLHAMAGAGTFYGIRCGRSEAGCEQMEWLCRGLGGTGVRRRRVLSVVLVFSALLGHAGTCWDMLGHAGTCWGVSQSIQCTQDYCAGDIWQPFPRLL